MRQVKWLLFILMFMTLSPLFFSSTLLAQGTSNTEVWVEEAAMCRQIVNRVPIGKGSVFNVGIERLYCFTKIVGAKTDTTIIHNWYLNGNLKASVTLPVNSASWRTWSSKEITPIEFGDWMVEVLTADGDALENILFLIQ